MIYCICRFTALVLCKILFRIKIYGKENLPKTDGFILASNHTSFLDPIVLGAVSPRKLSFMAKEELFANFLFARLISACGAFPIKRDAMDISAIKVAVKRLKKHGALVLFPEGTRSRSGVTPLLPGVGFLAKNAGVCVVPTNICGADKAWPVEAKFIRLHKISVCFGQPINIEGHTTYKEFSHRVMNAIRRMPRGE